MTTRAFLVAALVAQGCADAAPGGPRVIDATMGTTVYADGPGVVRYHLVADPGRRVCCRSDVLSELQIAEPEYVTEHTMQPGVLRAFALSGPVDTCVIVWAGAGTVRVWQPRMPED